MIDSGFNKRQQQQMERELAEANLPHNRYQQILDRWWQAQRDFEEELDDQYEVCGFQERWSETPSFTKSTRDRDWRVR
jgi:hypothetical protein